MAILITGLMATGMVLKDLDIPELDTLEAVEETSGPL